MVAGLLPPPGADGVVAVRPAEHVLQHGDLARVVLEVAAAADVRDRHLDAHVRLVGGGGGIAGLDREPREPDGLRRLAVGIRRCRPSARSTPAAVRCTTRTRAAGRASGSAPCTPCRRAPATPAAALHPWAVGSPGADSPAPSCSPAARTSSRGPRPRRRANRAPRAPAAAARGSRPSRWPGCWTCGRSCCPRPCPSPSAGARASPRGRRRTCSRSGAAGTPGAPGVDVIAGRHSPRATSVCVLVPGSTSSSLAAIWESEPADVMSATTVGDPISV